MPEPTVSVIIPAYNARGTIDLCLDSLAAQRGLETPFEVVVVDDCSTDGTVALVDAFAAAHRGLLAVRLLRQPVNQGPAAARNRGARDAVGAILLFTDSDCELDPDWVAEMTRPMGDPEVAAVKGAYRTKQPELVARFAQAEFEERYRMLERAERVDVLFSYSAGVRKQLFWDVGGFDTSFPVADNEDTDFSWKVASAGHRIVFNPRAIVYHRHPATLKQYLRKKFSRAYWRACVYRRFPGKAVRDSYTPQGLKLQIGLAGLGGLALFAVPVMPQAAYAFAAVAVAFAATTVPFVRALHASQADLILATPLLLAGRATAMAIGLVWVVPRLLRRDPFADTAKPVPETRR